VLVLTTCHATNFALVKSRGADAVIDSDDPDCACKIRQHLYTGTQESRLQYVLDCVSTRESYTVITDALLPEPICSHNDTDTNTDTEATVKFVTLCHRH
jgi:NADPH:quinone reductase-like Zn-dependent oxidoreductase